MPFCIYIQLKEKREQNYKDSHPQLCRCVISVLKAHSSFNLYSRQNVLFLLKRPIHLSISIHDKNHHFIYMTLNQDKISRKGCVCTPLVEIILSNLFISSSTERESRCDTLSPDKPSRFLIKLVVVSFIRRSHHCKFPFSQYIVIG